MGFFEWGIYELLCITSHFRQEWGNPNEKKDMADAPDVVGLSQSSLPKANAKLKEKDKPTPLLLERKIGDQKIAAPKDALSRKLLIPLHLTTSSRYHNLNN